MWMLSTEEQKLEPKLGQQVKHSPMSRESKGSHVMWQGKAKQATQCQEKPKIQH